MKSLFRKLRKDEINTSKYLRYAIGEILLVVVGILIALSINNWNERRKNEEQLLSILKEIRSDILGDLPMFQRIFKNGEEDDSLARVILESGYNLDTLSNTEKRSLFFTAMSYQPYEYSTFGFEKLQSIASSIPEKYDDIVRLLNQQYSTLGPIAKSTHEAEANYVEEKHRYLALNMPWYGDFRDGNITSQAEEFFSNGFIYKNWLSQFVRDNSAREGSFTHAYMMSSISSLVAVNEVLGVLHDPQLESILPSYSQDLDELKGVYINELNENVMELNRVGQYLFMNKFVLKQLGPDEFAGLFGERVTFIRDTAEKVVSISFGTRGGPPQKAIKQE